MVSKFEIIGVARAGLELYKLILKPDLGFGYVIYQKPPVRVAEIMIGPKWDQEDIEEMQKAVEAKIGKGISFEISKISTISKE